MRRVQIGTPITDFAARTPVNFDALFSSDSEEEVVAAARPSSPEQPYRKDSPDDPISVWTQKVTESFEKANEKPLSTDFKESLGRLTFFRRPVKEASVPKEKASTPTVDTK